MADRKIFIDDSPKNPNLKRSPFDWSFVNNVTYQFGKVGVPYLQYCPPGTKVDIKPTFAFKLAPLIYPTQTNVRCHLKFYKVPLRILWKDFEDFQSMIGTNGLPTNGGGTQFVVPYIKRESGWNNLGSLAEQIGAGNVRYVDVLNFVNTKGKVTTVNSPLGSLAFQGSSIPMFKAFDVPLKSPNLLHNVVEDEYEHTFRMQFVTSVQQPSHNGNVNLSVFCKKSDGTLESLSNLSATFSKQTGKSAYNNATSPVYLIDHSVVSRLDGHDVYTPYLRLRIPSSSFFFKVVNEFLNAGVELVFRFTFSGTLATLMIPDVSEQGVVNYVNTIQNVSKIDESTGNLTSTLELISIVSRFGLLDVVSVGTQTVVNDVTTIFDSVDGREPLEPVCALPFRALEFIHNYFMRNPRVDPFIKDGNPSYNKFLTNVDSGADSTTPVDDWLALYETDYFTSCVKEPQFGNAPLVGVTVNDLGDKGILRFDDGTEVGNYTVEVPIGDDGAALPVTMYKDIADRPNVQRLQELINYGISINDLRNVSTFQRMLERMQRTGHRYANVVYEFFGTNPPIGDHYPQYIGGVTRNITVDEITNTALSENFKLGQFAGQASFAGAGRNIKCFCSEASYVVGIIYFTVTPTYSQYLPKHLMYKHPLDFYLNPEFAHMGPQPVYVKEVAPAQVDAENLNDVFGYNRPYAELASRVDEVHGLYKTELANFLLQRMFGSVPQLNKSFIEIDPQHLLNIFSVTDTTDKIWGQIYFKVKASLPFPRSYQPRSI